MAAASRRGGGEYGIAWREAGSCANKQNVFDDFIACAEFLQTEGYTRPGKLVIQACLMSCRAGISAQRRFYIQEAVMEHLKGSSCCRVDQMAGCWLPPAQTRYHPEPQYSAMHSPGLPR